MKRILGVGKATATVGPRTILVLAVLVGLAPVVMCRTDSLDQSVMVNAAGNAAGAAYDGITRQLDRLEWAMGNVLAQVEYAFTPRFVSFGS